MKINRKQLGEALLDAALSQFQNVPSETEINHTFSQKFHDKMGDISKKSESVTWRVWQAPVKRAVLIAVLVVVMLAAVACATPAIRNTIVNFFFMEEETAYGITFNPNEIINAPLVIENVYAPLVIENVYAPSFEPDGYNLFQKEWDASRVECAWVNNHDEYIHYRQSLIQQNITDRTWLGINAEATNRTTKNINGYLVEIISNKEENQYVAVWTDSRYIYKADISVSGDNQEAILKEMIDSITEVKLMN